MADLRRPISDPFETVFYARETGLVGTVAYKLLDNDGNEIIAATTTGIIEIADGVYRAEPSAPGTAGQWSVVWSRDGTFGELTLGIDNLETYDPGVAAPTVGDLVPMDEDEFGLGVGPCQAWTTVEAVAECCEGAESDSSIFEDAIVAASEVLYALSANRFSGSCGPKRVRPCGRSACSFPHDFPVSWTGSGWAVLEGPVEPLPRSTGCGCSPLPVVPLAGWAREILEVTIDGQIIDPSTYRLDEHRRLVRTYDLDGDPAFWPACDDQRADYTEEGTFSVLYSYGLPVPAAGQLAARELSCAIYRSCNTGASANDADCVLPNNVVKVVRQGITLELKAFSGWAFQEKVGWATGMPLVDAFLNTYNPRGRRKRRTTVWSPDLDRYPRPLGDAVEAGT